MDGLTEDSPVKWSAPLALDTASISLAYIAGLFDGEGCASIDKAENQGSTYPRYQLHTTINLREGHVLRQIQSIFGGSLKRDRNRKLGHAPTWRWRLTSNGAAEFLIAIYPYLRFKREQAFFGARFQSLMTRRGGRRTESEALIQGDHYWLIRQLNKKGVSKWKGPHMEEE